MRHNIPPVETGDSHMNNPYISQLVLLVTNTTPASSPPRLPEIADCVITATHKAANIWDFAVKGGIIRRVQSEAREVKSAAQRSGRNNCWEVSCLENELEQAQGRLLKCQRALSGAP